MSVILSTLRRAYQRHPLAANIATVVGLIGAADTTCQALEHREGGRFNWTRLRNMVTVGACYYGPMYFYYYRWLDRKFPGAGPRTVLAKLCIDQLVVTIPSVAIFFAFMGKLERKPVEEIKGEIKGKFLPTYLTSCLFWPVAQTVNFSLVPSTYRVLYISSMTYVWLILLSAIINQPKLPWIVQKIHDITSFETEI